MRCSVKKVFFACRLQDSDCTAAVAGAATFPVCLWGGECQHRDCVSLHSRTSPQLQLVPEMSLTWFLTLKTFQQASPAKHILQELLLAAWAHKCDTPAPHHPNLQFRKVSPLILLSVHFGQCGKSCCHQESLPTCSGRWWLSPLCLSSGSGGALDSPGLLLWEEL